jgi:carbamoyl-phosphate synthase large subunit
VKGATIVSKTKTNVLILSAGRRVELLYAFREGLQHSYPDGKIYATDLNPTLSAACQVADQSFKVPRVTEPDYVNVLLDLCRNYSIRMIVPTIDTELLPLSINRELFSREGVSLIISDPAFIQACRDKRETGVLFKSMGIPYPEVYSRHCLQFPCFCKPYDGSRSVGAKPIMDVSQLSGDELEDEKNMFMELIPKTYKEYTVDGYYNSSHQLKALVCRERVEVRDGEVSKGITRKNFVYDYLKNKLAYIPGAIGCITFQFFVDEVSQDIKGLEINPRFGGGYPLTHRSGARFTDYLIMEYVLGKQVDYQGEWEDRLLMLRYDAGVYRKHEN